MSSSRLLFHSGYCDLDRDMKITAKVDYILDKLIDTCLIINIVIICSALFQSVHVQVPGPIQLNSLGLLRRFAKN